MGQDGKDKPLQFPNSSQVDTPSKFSKNSDSPYDSKEKQFVERNSLLTEMSRMKHIQAIKNVFNAFLIAFIAKEIALHISGNQRLDHVIDMVLWNFGGIGTVVILWAGMMTSSVLFYYIFYFWANHRIKLLKMSEKKNLIKQWDSCGLLSVVTYMVTFLLVPCILLVQRDLPIGSSVIILCEQVRLLMKKYAFVRSNAPKLGQNEEKSGIKHLPVISKFIYFLFAPTLIYRDMYPRKSYIKWKDVIWNFIEVTGIIFSWAIILERCVFPLYQNFGQEKISVGMLVVKMTCTIMPFLTLHSTGFYLLYHSWMNAFAEMMHFSDRLFYKDWWSCANYSKFFRSWNMIVGDWLYLNIYKDVASLSSVKGKNAGTNVSRPVIPRMAVFIISALFHEYIVVFALKFFFPVQFILFAVLGGFVTSIGRTEGDFWNTLMFLSLGIGDSIMIGFYCIEWYARKNCSTDLGPIMDFITPRFWQCWNYA